jgi:hypothetical protein
LQVDLPRAEQCAGIDGLVRPRTGSGDTWPVRPNDADEVIPGPLPQDPAEAVVEIGQPNARSASGCPVFT